jgi:hypothetical protein
VDCSYTDQRSVSPHLTRLVRRAYQHLAPRPFWISLPTFDTCLSMIIVLSSRPLQGALREASPGQDGMRASRGFALQADTREAPGETRPSATTSGTRECANARPKGTAPLCNAQRIRQGGLGANKPPRWSAERRASPARRLRKLVCAGRKAPRKRLRAYVTGPRKGAAAPERLSALRSLTLCGEGNGKPRRSLCLARIIMRVQFVVRSPHGAKRNAGTPAPDFAALHPGYKWATSRFSFISTL